MVWKSRHAVGLLLLALAAAPACARRMQQLPMSPSAQMFIHGIIQSMSLNTTCTATATSPVCGGTMTINNEVITVPANMMVMFPANALTWQEVFSGNQKSGLAQDDPPSPAGATYIADVTANRVGNLIIAALIDISQDPLVSGTGYIDAIDYTLGELTVSLDGGTTGSKIRLNDPTGRFGKVQTGPDFDFRFCVDPENPTSRSATGFPMCIPRTDPATQDDSLCPSANRPVAGGIPQATIQMPPSPTLINPADPTKMAPYMVGDYITFAGVQASGGFIAAYDINNNIAIYTAPGSDPAYTTWEAAIWGTGGLNVLGAGEAAIRTRYEGFTTDPTRPVQLWALDFAPVTGTYTKRDLGQVMPDPGPPNGATKGRWRFRPPCTNVGPLTPSSPYLGNKGCTPPPGGIYNPPTREVMIEVMGCVPKPDVVGNVGGCTYRNPTIEYIWPENVPGTPIVENNFQAVPFLALGGYTSGLGTIVSTLDPWPSNVLPANSCLPPTITPGGPYSVAIGGSFTVDATVAGPGVITSYTWADSSGTACSPSVAATFSALCAAPKNAVAGTSATFKLSVTTSCGQTFTATATATIVDAPKAAFLAIAPKTATSGATVSFTATLAAGSASSTFAWRSVPGTFTQSDVTTAPQSSTVTFTAPPLTDPTAPVTTFMYCDAKIGAVVSDTATAALTVNPPPDVVRITAVAFRCDKHRMTITATTSINKPTFGLKVLAYTDNAGKPYDTSILGNHMTYGLVGGIATYTYTVEPVPLPSMAIPSLTVMSDIGGSDSHKMVAADIRGTCTI